MSVPCPMTHGMSVVSPEVLIVGGGCALDCADTGLTMWWPGDW